MKKKEATDILKSYLFRMSSTQEKTPLSEAVLWLMGDYLRLVKKLKKDRGLR